MKRSNKPSPQATKLFDHIRELQIRIFVCFIVLAIFSTIAYFFYGPILEILRAPLNAPLYYNNPSGSFAFVMKICLMSALTITIPVIIYNLIMFIRPAFEKSLPLKRVYSTTAFSVLMAAIGIIFAYFCILPGALHFFGGFQVSGLHSLMSADSYLNFVTSIIITFMIVFQIPLLVAFIDSIRPITPKKMLKMEKWVILASLIIAALVPFAFDLMTCLFVALPIVLLYNLSIILVVMQHAKSARKERLATHAVIVKPESKPEFMTDPFYFEEFASELSSRKQTNLRNIASKQSVMDVQRIHRRPDEVQPAEWFLNRPKQVTSVGKQTSIISDVNRKTQTNHV